MTSSSRHLEFILRKLSFKLEIKNIFPWYLAFISKFIGLLNEKLKKIPTNLNTDPLKKERNFVQAYKMTRTNSFLFFTS